MTTTMLNGTAPGPKQIRFVNNQGQPPSKRPRIEAACLTCRRRKTRCSGNKPVCDTCQKNGHQCLGYGGDLVEKKKVQIRKRDSTGRAVASNGANQEHDQNEESLDEDDDEVVRQTWKGKTSNARTPASFVDSEDTIDHRESSSGASAHSGRPREHSHEWDQGGHPLMQAQVGHGKRVSFPRNSSYSEDGRSSSQKSPTQHSNRDQREREPRRVPYFRYFGNTAIVPGYKQMVVNVRDRRRSRGGSFSSNAPGTMVGYGPGHHPSSQLATVLENLDKSPEYVQKSDEPVHPAIISLVQAFFLHLGCNYPFLREERCLRLIEEKKLEPVLVHTMCALAARFAGRSKSNDDSSKSAEYGHDYADRVKKATVDTFSYPSVAHVQAYLLMAYESFGANQDTTLWMYLGLAIRMAVDLGLGRSVGIAIGGGSDPWYTRWTRRSTGGGDDDQPQGDQRDDEGPHGDQRDDDEDNEDNDDMEDDSEDEETRREERIMGQQEQAMEHQERVDTFWAVFILDRIISSGTGRPVSFRDEDFDIKLPPPSEIPGFNYPDPYPMFVRIIHLYGRVSDIFNNVKSNQDMTQDKLDRLAQMEKDLTNIYEGLNAKLHFNTDNFQDYVKAGLGTTFLLLHFWFHALIIVLHQPTFLLGGQSNGLVPNSRELSMSSAKTIADILTFAELIDAKSYVGNPFTCQPIYIAACSFLTESFAITAEPVSRPDSPTQEVKIKSEPHKTPTPRTLVGADPSRIAKHSLLASAATKNYQTCYKSLQQLQTYWEGVEYIIRALQQKSKGALNGARQLDSAIRLRSGSLKLRRAMSPAAEKAAEKGPVVAMALTGTTNSTNTTLSFLRQPGAAAAVAAASAAAVASGAYPPQPPPPPQQAPVQASTPPGNMIYDPIRQSLPDPPPIFPSAFPQANVSAVRAPLRPSKTKRSSNPSIGNNRFSHGVNQSRQDQNTPMEDVDTNSSEGDSKLHILAGVTSQSAQGLIQAQAAHSYPPSSHSSMNPQSPMQGDSPNSVMNEAGYYLQQHHHHAFSHQEQGNGMNNNMQHENADYFGHEMYQDYWSGGGFMPVLPPGQGFNPEVYADDARIDLPTLANNLAVEDAQTTLLDTELFLPGTLWPSQMGYNN